MTTPDDASDHFTTSSFPLSSIPTRTNLNLGPHSLSPSATGKHIINSKSKDSPQGSVIIDNRQLSPSYVSQSKNHDDKTTIPTTAAVTISRTVHNNHSPIGNFCYSI